MTKPKRNRIRPGRPAAVLVALLALAPGTAFARRTSPVATQPPRPGPSYIVVDMAQPSAAPTNILAHDQDLLRRPASLTKLMTIYLMCQTLTVDATRPAADRTFPRGLDTPVPISRTASDMTGSRLGLRNGTKVSLRTLATAMMTISANDAATAVGEAIAGKKQRFADLMNAEARKLGMLSSKFIDATGQDILLPYRPDANLSTASDMAILASRLYGTYGRQYAGILHPASVEYGGRQLANLEKDMLGRTEGVMGPVVLAKGGINVGGHDSAVVTQNGYVVVILGAPDTPALKSLRTDLFSQAQTLLGDSTRKMLAGRAAAATIGPVVRPAALKSQP